MSTRSGRAIERLLGFVADHRRLVLALWGVVFVASLLPFSLETGRLTTGGYKVPGSESHRVEEASRLFPSLKPNGTAVLVLPPEGRRLSPGEVAAARAAVGEALATDAEVGLTPPRRTVAAPGRTAAMIPLRGPEDEDAAKDAATDVRPQLPDEVGQAKVYFVGQPAVWAGFDVVSKKSLTSAEAIGLPLTGLILIAVFGSLAAALLPLALGLISITIAGAVIYFVAGAVPMSEFVSNIASLIGIAVGVDYSLFILARYRAELAEGRSQEVALRNALGSSGRAVLFSGFAVALALSGLFLVDSITLRSMALGAIIVVLIALLGALTLTPAAIITLGPRLHRPSRRIAAALQALQRPFRRADRAGFWEAWGERVTGRPWVALGAALTILVVLALPAFSMKTVTEALPQLPSDSPARIGAEAAIERFGPAASGETYVLESYPEGVRPALERQALAAVRADPAVLRVRQIHGVDPDQVMLGIVTREDAESEGARAFVDRLHRRLAPLDATGGATFSLGGTAAHEVQFDRQISGSLWGVAAFVLVACALVIMLMLGSIVLPLKAIAMNILTVAASFGVLVALFQWGWFSGILGLEAPGYVATLALPFVLAVTFGLSMDYEVFLLARIQEEYERGGDTKLAVLRVLKTSGKTITSAALIMVVVFLAFVAVSLTTIKMIGVGLAVAIALDATVVRLVLVPAAVVLLGRANWWLPRPLRRFSRQPTTTAVVGD